MNIKIPSSEDSLHRIKEHINRTPFIYSERLSNRTKSNVYLKLENLQKTGSFKVRGALNKVFLNKNQGKTIAASSGNHGAAVSYSLSKKKQKGIIYVPNNAKSSKIENIKFYGSDVIKYGNDCLDAENEAIKYSKDNNLEFISPYNDIDVISGQGTIGVEIMEEREDIEVVFVTVGGGGLISGIANYFPTCSNMPTSLLTGGPEGNGEGPSRKQISKFEISTSNLPNLKSLMISTLSTVSTSECIYLAEILFSFK